MQYRADEKIRFFSSLLEERMVELAVVPQCNILGYPSGRAPTPGRRSEFNRYKIPCSDLSTNMVRKAIPIAAGVVVLAWRPRY
jgi:hypothetical protein